MHIVGLIYEGVSYPVERPDVHCAPARSWRGQNLLKARIWAFKRSFGTHCSFNPKGKEVSIQLGGGMGTHGPLSGVVDRHLIGVKSHVHG